MTPDDWGDVWLALGAMLGAATLIAGVAYLLFYSVDFVLPLPT